MAYHDEVRVERTIQKRISKLSVDTLVAILDNVYKGVVCIDTEGRITFLSRSNEKFYNLKPGEAIGKHVTEVIKNSRLHYVAKTGVPEIGLPIKLKDGQYRIAERLPIKKDGKIIGAIGKIMFHDIEKAKVLSERIDQLEHKISDFREQIRDLFEAKYTFDDIVGRSDVLQKTKKMALQTARTSSTVLIQGESGTGKELFAHAIHNASPRRNFHFIRVNCASIPPELFESELFGYAQGAFTGARRKGKKGQFQLADRGTIFLDEIAELPIYMQAKLLRVLQEKEVVSVGGDKPVSVDFRLIVSTNKSLKDMVFSGQFREDLFYRLNVVHLKIPPLRERKEDLPFLVNHMIKELNPRLGTSVVKISQDAWQVLDSYEWKGNVRELRNVLECALTTCRGDTLQAKHLRLSPIQEAVGNQGLKSVSSLKESVMAAEKRAIISALELAGGNKNRASRMLGISRAGLYNKMKTYCVDGSVQRLSPLKKGE